MVVDTEKQAIPSGRSLRRGLVRVHPVNLETNSNLSTGVGVTAIQDAEHILEVNSFSAPSIIQAVFSVIPHVEVTSQYVTSEVVSGDQVFSLGSLSPPVDSQESMPWITVSQALAEEHSLEVNPFSAPSIIQTVFPVIPRIEVTSKYVTSEVVPVDQVLSLGSISPPLFIETARPIAISQRVDSNLSLNLSLVEEAVSGDQVLSGGQVAIMHPIVEGSVAVIPRVVVPLVVPPGFDRCALQACLTCRAMVDDHDSEPNGMSCPVVGCHMHKEMYSKVPMNGFTPLRNHIRKHHSAQDLVGVSKVMLFRHYRLTVCNKLGCGKIVMAKINQRIPQQDANCEETYERMSATKQHGCALAIPVRENAVGVGNVHIIADNMDGPNSSFFPWLAEALRVVDSVKGVSELPSVPPMVARLPVGSHIIVQGIAQIFMVITQAMGMSGVSLIDVINLWTLVAVLPRFLFLAPCSEG